MKDYQKVAIETDKKQVIVNAAAASGKTFIITERVKWLVKNNVARDRIVVITFTNNAAGEMKKRLGSDGDGIFIGTIHSYVNYLLLCSGVDTLNILEKERFNELFEMIIKHKSCIKPVEHLLLDEAQDSDERQWNFILKDVKPKNLYAVGDLNQCQPEGTMIQLASGETRAIEDLVVGDQLITYDVNSGRVLGGKSHNATNCKVLGIDTHIEDEPLVKVTFEDGNSTMYSYNHKTLMCLDDIKENFLVYLMCDKNNRFRVGKSQFKDTTNTNIYRAKMRAEGCQKIWILKTFKTDKEARVYEDKISYFYRIPQVTFQLNKTTYTQEDIDYIYDGLDTYQNALSCLHDHHKYYDYPFCSSNDNNHFASNTYGECYACNLIAANMSMLQFDPDRTLNQKERKKRIAISHIEYIAGAHRVYSLSVEKTHTYVADNIITHNCIYGFTGATPEIMESLMNDTNTTVYNLPINHRNDISILNYAKKIINKNNYDMPDESVANSTNMGKVIEAEYSDETLIKYIKNSIIEGKEYKDWFVLGRSNAQVEEMFNTLSAHDIPCDTFKKADLTNEQLSDKMNTNTVKVLTIHSSKGLENDCVAVRGGVFWKPEERRVCYVAATRAKHMLLWFVQPKKKKRKKQDVFNWE